MKGFIQTVAFIVLLVCCGLMSGACVETKSSLCPTGRRCPEGTFCAANRDICIRFTCGNGVVDGPDEVCDDGNNLDRDGCSADCRSTEKCGDNVVNPLSGEECDDGNTIDGDGCQATCTNPLCGDGIVDATFNEACDEGAANSSDPDAKCRFNCQPQRCGDGIEDSGEVCDDGNLAVKDGCTPDCRSDETCGNGYVDFLLDELCDDGNALSRDGCTSSCATEKPLWTKRTYTDFSTIVAYAMAYDASRGRIVFFGGKNFVNEPNNETWEYDGVAWVKITPTGGSPSARADHAMAYDAARRRVVMFGGFAGGTSRGDTWEWDGKTWTQVTPPAGFSPAPRHAHAMTYDAARGRVVLFGGSVVPDTGVADTWEWDGKTWSQIIPADSVSPPARFAGAMAYDAARNRVVLYGGSYFDTFYNKILSLDDTWEWDGTTWTELHPMGQLPPAPPWKVTHVMAYDAVHGRIVLHSGSMWEWDGTVWTEKLSGASAPSWIREHDIVYDVARDRLTVVDAGSTWLWDGSAWTESPTSNSVPGGRTGPAMAYDSKRARTVLFGGDYANSTDTWEWNGTTWTKYTPASMPPCCGKMVYDAEHERILHYGWGETWEWDGTNWGRRMPATSPPVRFGHAMAYDAVRGRVVLFGGEFGGQIFDDTWEWDGTNWTSIDVIGSPPPGRYDHAMAYDDKRGRVLLFGGFDFAALSDTWEWDGSKWVELASAGTTPSARYGHAMTYNPARDRIALFGGFDSIYRADTWEWDGIDWTEVSTVVSPEPRAFGAAVFDAARNRVVLFGGGENFPIANDDAWQFSYERDGQIYETCLYGFDNDGDGLIGCSDPDCWGYCTPSCPPESPAACDAAAFSQCGDGACNAELETCMSCPKDCGICPSICGDFLCNAGESCPADCNTP